MFDSFEYWQNRYLTGPKFGNDYDEEVKIKANYINKFIEGYDIKRVFDYGCGDGRQSQYIKVENYLGAEISEIAINRCKELNSDKKFYLIKKNDNDLKRLLKKFKPDLCLSLWVISHLIEDELFKEYMENLFCSERFVFIHSMNEDQVFKAEYQKHRNFTKYIGENWKLLGQKETCTKYEYIYERILLS